MMDNRVTIYPSPVKEVESDDYCVSVNGKSVFVYRARVSSVPFNQVWPGYQRPLNQTELASFAYWDMSEPVTVEVISRRPIKSVDIRPKSYRIQPNVQDNKITFQMIRPRQITVEVNGIHHALHLFANSLAENVPDPDETNVLYFGPGIHRAGKIELKSGETIYIAGGAIVHATIQARQASNIRILGRGILDVSTSPGKTKIGIMPFNMFCPGSVGLISRSGTLTYEVGGALCEAGLGQSTAVVIKYSHKSFLSKMGEEKKYVIHKPN